MKYQVSPLRLGKVPGVISSFELALRFSAWATDLHRDPTWQEIAARFNVQRCTAYRWLASWRSARGAVQP